MHLDEQIQQIVCFNKQHGSNKIKLICKNIQCKDKRYCCVQCIDNQHRKHNLITLKKFSKQLKSKIYHNSQLQKKKQILEIINNQQKALLSIIDQIKNQILKSLYQNELKINLFYQKIYQSFVIQDYQNIHQQIFIKYNYDAVNQYLQKIQASQDIVLSSPQQTYILMKSINKSIEKSFQETKQNILSVSKKLLTTLEKIKMPKIQGEKVNHSFSTKLKCVSLKISDSGNEVERINGSGGHPIALTERPLDPINNKISFIITKQSQFQGIWIGVCIYDIVKGNNYQNCCGFGKGVYAIDQKSFQYQSAFSWNHHSSSHNGQAIVGFNFGVGEKIEIEVDFLNSNINFKKGQAIYSQPIKVNIGQIYAFAGATNYGDHISIVSD